MAYDPPGRADNLDGPLLDAWNTRVAEEYKQIFAKHGSRFITADPATLDEAKPLDVHWFADPVEPVTCLDPASARQLADWPVVGRNELQDEYAEFAIELGVDKSGKRRPKRVQITTELREYWLTIAVADPDAVADMAEDVLGRRPSFTELYGVDDPVALEPAERKARFEHRVAGSDEISPSGELNTANALFMTHRINGLKDLIYIVMFGAKPYAVLLPNGSRRPAGRDEIFFPKGKGTQILACRHADPVAALSAHRAAWEGRTVAFANPLGMYIQTFDQAALSLDGEALPEEWISWGRGEEAMRQRLVVGPPDKDERFLDDITVLGGAADEPLLGGYQLLKLIEVGPLASQGTPSAIDTKEFVDVPALDEAIDCQAEWVCSPILKLKQRFDLERAKERTGRRS